MNKYTFEQIEIGMKESFCVQVAQEYVDCFRKHTGDINLLHANKDYAKQKGFDEPVVFGMLTASYLSTLAGVYLPGEKSLIHSVDTTFLKPVFCGDTLTVCGVVKNKHDVFRFIDLSCDIKNQNGDKVVKAKMRVGVMDE